MKLLDILSHLEKYGRVKRKDWNGCFLIKPVDDDYPLIFCNVDNLIIKSYPISYKELVADDWEVVK